MNKQLLKPDFCVIGAGSGGLSFAAGAAQMGARVVLLESKKMGGDCLNYGCVPSKALIAAAKFGHESLRSKDFGWVCEEPRVDFKKVYDHIHHVIRTIEPNDSIERFEKLGVQVILEQGSFSSDKTVDTPNYIIQAKRFVIATGSTPDLPPIPGLASMPYLTNETIFDLKERPQHLVVIGGGPIGVEMAQAFLRLGSQVTVLTTSSILPKDDPQITQKLKTILMDEGIDLHEHIQTLSMKQVEQKIHIAYQTSDGELKQAIASHVLVATGRKPNIQHLNLELAGIRYSSRGIEVNEHLQTSHPKVYAIGDCTGGYLFTHVAGYQAGLAIRNCIFGLRTKMQTRAIPWVTYTDPELAHVGWMEHQLKEKQIPYQTLHMTFDENDRAQAQKRTDGMIKVLVSPKGDVLAATILGVHAGEMIYPWVMAIQNKLKLTAITSSIAPYPTFSDISKKVAGSFYAEKIFSPRMKTIVGWIMKYWRS